MCEFKNLLNKEKVVLVILNGASQGDINNIVETLRKELKLSKDTGFVMTSKDMIIYKRDFKDFSIKNLKMFLQWKELIE